MKTAGSFCSDLHSQKYFSTLIKVKTRNQIIWDSRELITYSSISVYFLSVYNNIPPKRTKKKTWKWNHKIISSGRKFVDFFICTQDVCIRSYMIQVKSIHCHCCLISSYIYLVCLFNNVSFRYFIIHLLGICKRVHNIYSCGSIFVAVIVLYYVDLINITSMLFFSCIYLYFLYDYCPF